jgi:excisionase family DNA binding protein
VVVHLWLVARLGGKSRMIESSSSTNSALLTKPVLNKPEAAELLIIKPRTLDDWMRKKRIPFCKLPSGAVRFRTDQLLEFLSKFEVK